SLRAQHGEIGEIVKEVTSILSHNFSTTPNDTVGMQSQVEELENILVLDSNADVKVVGISGMGGIGKSTLAASLYCRISNQFDASCFIDDISKLFGDHGQIDGPIEAQKQILSQTLNGGNLPLYNSIKTSNFIQTRLRHKKVLIVLDNVDEAKQLDKLAIKHCLGGGSRIIIISRDEHILQEYQVDKVYTVQLLNYRDALQLFCRKAFKCDDTMRDYIDLTNEALSYANGLPLAIKVLGSFLFGLDVSEWRGALVRLRENPKKDIMDMLRISFDALEDSEKEIFLDISCFFHGNLRENVENILDIRGFHPKIGIKVLIDKSLVTINESETIEMHDLLIELGRSIVREKSPKGPRKWSRLWDCNDLYIVLQENMAAENLEAIGCESSVEFPKTMRADTFSKMICLKLLILRTVRLKFSESLNCLSSELQYLDWDDYPFQYLPPNFEPDKLVELYLCRSSIKQLWKEPKGLHHLRLLNLSYSKNLIKLPNFREIPNLEFLSLEGCIKLVQIDPSIGILTKLVYLNLRYCENLVSIPNIIFGLSSLNQLLLSGCSKLFQNQLLREPRHVDHVKILEINGTGIKTSANILHPQNSKVPFALFLFGKA
ncbi:disease resistance protein RUN1-like, partial [Lotus japonicus]|uniref:disease resistance protein RUN1-like n=1 Tax=Lotus japonicus TaxID=34305 RepID=UPI0025893A36